MPFVVDPNGNCQKTTLSAGSNVLGLAGMPDDDVWATFKLRIFLMAVGLLYGTAIMFLSRYIKGDAIVFFLPPFVFAEIGVAILAARWIRRFAAALARR